MTHEDRLLRSDVDAIARDPAEVEARLRAQRNNPHDVRLWVTAAQDDAARRRCRLDGVHEPGA